MCRRTEEEVGPTVGQKFEVLNTLRINQSVTQNLATGAIGDSLAHQQ